jgi:predicted ATPase
MIVLAHDSKNPYDLAFGRFFEGYLHRFLREPQHAEAAATQAFAICEERGFQFVRDIARIVIGWARAQLGSAGEGVLLIRHSIAGLSEARARLGITDYLTCLAEAQALDGMMDDAISTIEEALQANSEELVFRPIALTCRGELRLKVGNLELAEGDFREAIRLAQRMSAKMYELRATMSLARLRDQQGRRDEARAMLAEIYNWFTEGFDTADLKDAKALLDELHEDR